MSSIRDTVLFLPREAFLRAPRRVRRPVLRALGKLPPPPTPTPTPVVSAPPATEPPATGFNRSYVTGRPDLVARLPSGCRSVLDLGCATGEVGVAVMARDRHVRVTGVEIDPAMAAEAATRLHRVLAIDLDDADALRTAFEPDEFDGVIAGDVLEHLVDPWRTLRMLAPYVATGGWVVASLPNIGHWATWWQVVVHHRWPYRMRGVHDSTHLRFFARRNIEPLFEQAGFEVVRIDRSARLTDRADHRYEHHAPRLARIPGLRDLLTYQFLIVAQRQPGTGSAQVGSDESWSELLPPEP